MGGRFIKMIVRASIISLITLALGTAHAGEALSSSGQSAAEIEDIGEIKAAEDGEAQSKWRGSVNVRGDYTSNAHLTGYHDSSDFLFLPTIELGYHTPLGAQFSFDVAAKLELALYSKYEERGFAGYSLISTLDWRPQPNAPRIYIGIEPYRYDSFDTGDLLTQALGLTIGTDWGFAFNSGRSLAFAGYSFTDYLADPTIDSRTQNKIVLGLTHQLRPQLYAQLIYAWQYSDFLNNDRHDSKHLIGLNLTYQLRRNLFTTLSGNWVTNDSDEVKGSYESAGAALGVTWQF